MKQPAYSHKHNAHRHRTGFTLLELLVVVGIIGFILIVIVQLFGFTLSGSSKSRVLASLKEDGQFALSNMERAVRRAKQVQTCSGSTLTVVVVEMVGGLPVDTTYAYTLTGAKILLNGTALTSAAADVVSFTCTLIAASQGKPAVVTLTLTLQKMSASIDEQALAQTFQTSVSLRSY